MMNQGPCCKIKMLMRAHDMIIGRHTLDMKPQGRIENEKQNNMSAV